MIRDVNSVNTPSGPNNSSPSLSTRAIRRSNVASSINGLATASISLSVVVTEVSSISVRTPHTKNSTPLEGLYSSIIADWRRQHRQGLLIAGLGLGRSDGGR